MKRLILVTVWALVIVLCAGGGIRLRREYRQFKVVRGLRLARAYRAGGDLANASLSARQVLQTAPDNLEATHLIAELAELRHSPSTVDWRHRVAQLAPTVPNKLKFASSALRLQRPPYTLTQEILRDLEPAARDNAAFHVVSAELALRLGQPERAAARFQTAARLEPTNRLHQLNLAVMNLLSTNSLGAEAARGVLAELSLDPQLGPLSLRWQVVDYLFRNDLRGAEHASERLLADPRSSLEDRLQQLHILQLAKNLSEQATAPTAATAGPTVLLPEGLAPGTGGTSTGQRGQREAASARQAFEEYLSALEKGASTNAYEFFSTCEWLGSHGLAEEALRWVATLDREFRLTQPVPLAEANLYTAKGDWSELERFLKDQKWAELEFLRLALLARAAWGLDHRREGEIRWLGATRAATERLGALTLLLSLASEWGRDPDEVLWEIGRRFSSERWAFGELERRYAALGNTRGLNKVYAVTANASALGCDCTNQNNFAVTSLLLGANLSRAHEMALGLYRHHPADPVLASTYAYSLHLQGRTGDGLRVLSRLDAAALRAPAVALYYGVLLAAAGDADLASQYLALADAVNLLPEEKELLAQARRPRLRSP